MHTPGTSETNSIEADFAAVCARPATAQALQEGGLYNSLVAQWPSKEQLPIVYHKKYNITLMGVEKLHPFDSCKFRKVVTALESEGLISLNQLVTPLEAPMDVLADVHTQEYLDQIHNSNLKIVQVTELPPLFIIPTPLLRWSVVSPMKHHVAGTMLAAALAVERGWAVNIGGGMHHAHASNGMGWCAFSDIHLAVRLVRKASGGRVQRVLYVDLDAHQGNGVARDKLAFQDHDLFIVDVYNQAVFPKDYEAKRGIDVDVALERGVGDDEYLAAVRGALASATAAFPDPDLIFYNAGTDVLAGDPLGRMAVTQEGVLKRDALVWAYALHTARAPIVMVLSGGYGPQSAPTITASLSALMRTHRLAGTARQHAMEMSQPPRPPQPPQQQPTPEGHEQAAGPTAECSECGCDEEQPPNEQQQNGRQRQQ